MRVPRHLSGVVQTRGGLIRDLRQAYGLLVRSTAKRGRRRGAAPPTSPTRRASSRRRQPSGTVSFFAKPSSRWRRARLVPIVASRRRRWRHPYAIAATRTKIGAVPIETRTGLEPQAKTTHKTQENYLTPGDPIFVEVALPRASFSFEVDFWWSFVWSFTPFSIVTMFVSRTIPAITISSRM